MKMERRAFMKTIAVLGAAFGVILFLASLSAGAAAPAAAPNCDRPYVSGDRSLKIKNRTGGDVTDFHIKFWQKEDDIKICEVVTLKVYTRPTRSGPRTAVNNCAQSPGYQPDRNVPGIGNPHQNIQTLRGPAASADDQTHAIDVSCAFDPLKPGEWIEIDFQWKLSEFNTKNKEKIVWTTDGQLATPAPAPGTPTAAPGTPTAAPGPPPAGEAQALPDHGWEVSDPEPISPGQWTHNFKLCNYDSTDELHVEEVKLGAAPAPLLSGIEVDNFADWDPAANTGPTVLLPGECSVTPIVTAGPFEGGTIVGRYLLTASPEISAEDLLLHEIRVSTVGGLVDLNAGQEAAPRSSDQPASFPYGLAVAAVGIALALAAGGWFARRRWLW